MRKSGFVSRIKVVLAGAVTLVGEAVAIAASAPGSPRWNEVVVAADGVAYAAVGALILWHRPRHPVGRIALAGAAAGAIGEALVALAHAALTDDPGDTLAAYGSVLGFALRALTWVSLVLWLPLVFPHGLGERTRLRRIAIRVVATTAASFTLVSLLSPRLTDLRLAKIRNPIGLPESARPFADALGGLSLLLGLASIALGVACLAQRYRRGATLTRQQTLIFGLAFLPPVAAVVASAWDAAAPWLFGVTTLPLPVAIGVAVLQRRLYDLPLVLNRSMTYGSLSLVIATLYAAVVGGVGAMLRQEGAAWLPWLAAGVVAVSFSPLRDGLQRAANRLTFGQWAQPTEVLARTARRLSDAGDVGALMGSLAAELADDLGLGYVLITDRSGLPLAAAGVESKDLDELPLTAYGEVVGALRWTRRGLRESDLALLTGIAGQLGTVVHAQGLLASVRAAQERLVLAREEERRRLRRDLHDGLGPSLAALTMQVDTLRNTVDDEAARTRLLTLRGHIQDAVIDIRSIVEGLQPAALADLGLPGSLRVLAARFHHAATFEVAVDVDVPAELPAAVEVGAYRIVQESLTNAAKHSGAKQVRVGVRLDDGWLEVHVDDDGCGELRPRPDGVGLSSMRGRAEEIGGTLEVLALAGQGTTVCARLPVDGRPAR